MKLIFIDSIPQHLAVFIKKIEINLMMIKNLEKDLVLEPLEN